MRMKSALSFEDSARILPALVSYDDLLVMNLKPMERGKRDQSWLGLRRRQDRIR